MSTAAMSRGVVERKGEGLVPIGAVQDFAILKLKYSTCASTNTMFKLVTRSTYW
jgi:hypothetical protein